MFYSKKTRILLMFLLLFSLFVSNIYVIFSTLPNAAVVPTYGTIKTINVNAFTDSHLQNTLTDIEWGSLYPGSEKNVTIYIHSISNVKTKLHLDTYDFRPNYIADSVYVSWDYSGMPVSPNEIVKVTIFLLISKNEEIVYNLVDKESTIDFNVGLQIAATEF